MTEINAVHQSCKDCIFARYNGRTQTGCNFGDRLQRYEDLDALVEARDDDKEFYIVNGRLCLAYRDRAWARGIDDDVVLAIMARRELRQKVDIVVVLAGDVQKDSLERTIASLKAMTLPPSALHIINNQDAIPVSELHVWLSQLTRDWSVPYFLTNIVERRGDGERVSDTRAIDLTVHKMKGHFYGIFSPGAVVPPNYAEAIDHAVVDELARFVILLPDVISAEGLTVALGFHRSPIIQGNKVIAASAFDDTYKPSSAASTLFLHDVVQKALYLANAKNMPYLVTPLEDVCRCA